MTIGDRIKNIRVGKGLKQKELAALAGIPTITLQQYERGVTKQPQIEQIQKIASALDVPISILLGVTDADETGSFSSAALDMAFSEHFSQQTAGLQKQAQHQKIVGREEIKQLITTAEQEHNAYLESLCFDPLILDEDYPARIRYVTSFIEKNSDMLKLAMPGTHMLPDDIEQAKRIREDKDSNDE